MPCFDSPPVRYALALTARSPARFLRFSAVSWLPTMTSLLSAFCWRFLATSSRMALHSLSTRHGLPILAMLLKSHSLSFAAWGGGGGGSAGACTFTLVEPGELRPRESLQV